MRLYGKSVLSLTRESNQVFQYSATAERFRSQLLDNRQNAMRLSDQQVWAYTQKKKISRSTR
jgi:hypothetical protein